MRWLSAFVAGASVVVATSALAGPRLVLPEATFDFGAVERGTRIDHVFRVRNDGDAPAAVLGLERTCACVVGAAADRMVGPGREFWVSVGLDTEGLTGPVVKAVTVRTSDPGAPALRLVVRGTVLSDLVPEPATLYVGEVWRGSEAQASALLRAGRPGGAARVLSVRARGPFVVPRLSEDPVDGLRVTVVVAPDAPLGRFRDEVVIRASGLDGPVTVPVLGVVRGPDDASAPRVAARRVATIRR